MATRVSFSGEPDTISLFSGVGGLDLGGALAGLHVGVATDHDAAALRILHDALATTTLTASSDGLTAGSLLKAGKVRAKQVRYVIGGPPCTAFSHAGFWIATKRDGQDPAAGRLNDYLRLLGELSPRAFVLENVPGLQFKTHRRFYQEFVAAAEAKDYRVTAEILCASHFGVPQRRRRLFIVGVRDALPFRFPKQALAMPRTTRWAIGDLEGRDALQEPDESHGGKYAGLLPHIPPGGNYLHFTAQRGCAEPLFRYRGRYWSFLLKLDPDAPSPTVPAQRVTNNGPFHWANRHLRLREMARLQLFPDWYPLDEDRQRARRQLGNAVPPLLAAHVIWHLRAHLGDVDVGEVPKLLRTACDPAATVGRVMKTMTLPAATTKTPVSSRTRSTRLSGRPYLDNKRPRTPRAARA